MRVIRLLLAHELALPRAALRSLLESDTGIEIVADVDNADQLQAQQSTQHPDVILMTVSQRAGLGSALIETLRRQDSNAKVLAVSPHDEMSFVRLLMAAGAAGYVCERSPASELRAALREVSQGRTFIDSTIADRADPETLGKLKTIADGQKSSAFLSKRETEVLRMLAQGFTNQQVADALSLSVKTAETYRVRLTRKLGVKSRSELFRYAFEVGMIGPDQLSPSP